VLDKGLLCSKFPLLFFLLFIYFFIVSEYKNQRDIDYIPLSTCGATEFGVMPLDKFMRAPKSMAERAAAFRQNMLFGTHIRRGPGAFG